MFWIAYLWSIVVTVATHLAEVLFFPGSSQGVQEFANSVRSFVADGWRDDFVEVDH